LTPFQSERAPQFLFTGDRSVADDYVRPSPEHIVAHEGQALRFFCNFLGKLEVKGIKNKVAC
jgi:hypothetical protein